MEHTLICQQTYGDCNRPATQHLIGADWNVDVCDEHAADVIAEYGPVFQAPGYDYASGEPRVNVSSRDSILRWLNWNSRSNADISDIVTLDVARAALIEAYFQSTGDSIILAAASN